MPRREGDKILFDSYRQQEEFAASLRIGTDIFHMQLLKLMADSMEEYERAWNWLREEIGPLEDDEELIYEFNSRECLVKRRNTMRSPK